MSSRLPFAAGLAGLLCLSASGQDPKVNIPPDAVPATFRMYLVTDYRFPFLKNPDNTPKKGADGKDVRDARDRTEKMHCLVCDYGLSPVVAVFVRADAKTLGADSGVGKLAKRLDALIPRYRADKLAGFVAFLQLEAGEKTVTGKTKQPDGTEVESMVVLDFEYPDDEKRDVYAKDIRDLANGLNTPNVPFGLAATKSKALTAWGVAEKDEVTVIVYYRMRRVGTPWRFAQAADLTDAKIDAILDATEEKITGKKKVKKE